VAIKVDEHTKVIETGGDYRQVNPLGYVPALVLDDGTLLTEGAAIVQYIADQVPSKNLAPPNGTIERTKLQAWLNFFSSEMHKGGFSPLFYKGVPEEGKDVFRKRLVARYSHLNEHLKNNEYPSWDARTRSPTHIFSSCRAGRTG
jgi:glutathione S-transferase